MLFDRHAMVDWSAASKPTRGRDSIWIAQRTRGGITLDNPATRHEALSRLRAICLAAIDGGERLLIGFDFPFGYPAGVAGHLTGSDDATALWCWIADRFEDDADNSNNRFEVAGEMTRSWPGTGPFWGRPATVEAPDIPERATARSGGPHPPERRMCEARARGAKSVWQLAYAGAVGSQVIAGLPTLLALREDPEFGDKVRVWPFETGFTPGESQIVIAEIYPSLIAPDPVEPIKDAGQVRAVADWLARLDADGTLAAQFSGPTDLDPAEQEAVTREEGWILGLEAATSGPCDPPWLTVVGIGEDGYDGLAPAAREALIRAEVIIGGDRHPILPPVVTAERRPWPHPFGALIEELRALKSRSPALLVAGDPLWYSIGARITRAIPAAEITFHPALSAFQHAASRLGWSLADCETLTAHRRPAAQIVPFFWHGARLLVLSDGRHTPGELARLLARSGYGASRITVLGALGGPEESWSEGLAQDWSEEDPASTLPDLHLIAIECDGHPACPLPRVPGLPDTAFTGRPLPREIRTAALARLMPERDGVLWEIGVGAGDVAIEWMRAARNAEAVVVDTGQEPSPATLADAERLGTPRLHQLHGKLPAVLDRIPRRKGAGLDLRAPHAVLFRSPPSASAYRATMSFLPPHARVVAVARSTAEKRSLEEMFTCRGGEMTEITVRSATCAEGHVTWETGPSVALWWL